MFRSLLPFILTLAMVSLSSADYQIGLQFSDITFLEPQNSLFDGACCNTTCPSSGDVCCEGVQCSPSLRLCFRDSMHPIEDIDSDCLLEVTRNTAEFLISMGTDFDPINGFYTGGFQVFVRVAQSPTDMPDFDPPFSEPLIDEAFPEFMIDSVLFEDRFDTLPVVQNVTGRFNRVTFDLTIASVHCADGWNGSHCEIFCSGNTCTQQLFPPSTTPPTTPAPPTSTPEEEQSSLVSAIAGGVLGVFLGAVLTLSCVVVIVSLVLCKRKKDKIQREESRQGSGDVITSKNRVYEAHSHQEDQEEQRSGDIVTSQNRAYEHNEVINHEYEEIEETTLTSSENVAYGSRLMFTAGHGYYEN